MASREKRLTIPVALAAALLVPGLACSGASTPASDGGDGDAGGCLCTYLGPGSGPIPDGGLPDASVGEIIPCSGDTDPHITDPLWSCSGFV